MMEIFLFIQKNIMIDHLQRIILKARKQLCIVKIFMYFNYNSGEVVRGSTIHSIECCKTIGEHPCRTLVNNILHRTLFSAEYLSAFVRMTGNVLSSKTGSLEIGLLHCFYVLTHLSFLSIMCLFCGVAPCLRVLQWRRMSLFFINSIRHLPFAPFV